MAERATSSENFCLLRIMPSFGFINNYGLASLYPGAWHWGWYIGSTSRTRKRDNSHEPVQPVLWEFREGLSMEHSPEIKRKFKYIDSLLSHPKKCQTRSPLTGLSVSSLNLQQSIFRKVTGMTKWKFGYVTPLLRTIKYKVLSWPPWSATSWISPPTFAFQGPQSRPLAFFSLNAQSKFLSLPGSNVHSSARPLLTNQ